MKCRHCGTALQHVFLDLGHAPPSNAYLDEAQLRAPEITYPLKLFVCGTCWLVQTQDFVAAEALFTTDYAYYSSTSTSWLRHASDYSAMIIDRLGLNTQSRVIEVASNDGYLLRNFVEKGIPCLGIEPTAGTAAAAEALGIPVVREFFGSSLADQFAASGQLADLIIGNNVYAHVQNINDFTAGMKRALKPGGTITLEFPHLIQMLQKCQFDTVYHEHYSYLSLNTVQHIFSMHGLRIFEAEELATHGGSLRVYGCHLEDLRPTTNSVAKILNVEAIDGLQKLETYLGFQDRANQIKNSFVGYLLDCKRQHRRVIGYGAAAKGNTLLNYAGVKADLLPYVCDAAPSKQSKYLPGSHIPIRPPEALLNDRPDEILILPWNIADEVKFQFSGLASAGVRFVTAVPKLTIV